MTTGVHMRRLPTFGWSIETGEGEVRAIRRDDGRTLRGVDSLVGTQEAARSVGLRPSNFVRDWASRPDFPVPVATLSSGRVWLAADVDAYARDRRAPRPTQGRMAEIAARIVWWQNPEQTLQRPRVFVARVMASGTLGEVRDVERFFGRRVLNEALTEAPPGIFDRRSWNYWLLVLGRDRTTPLPLRHVP